MARIILPAAYLLLFLGCLYLYTWFMVRSSKRHAARRRRERGITPAE